MDGQGTPCRDRVQTGKSELPDWPADLNFVYVSSHCKRKETEGI